MACSIRRFGWSATAAVCVTALGAMGSRAEDDPCAALEAALRSGDAVAAAKVLGGEEGADFLRERTSRIQALGALEVENAPRLAKSDQEAAVRVADCLVDVATTCVDAAPQDADAHLARAEVLFARGRVRVCIDPKTPSDDWLAAAADLHGAYDIEKQEETLRRSSVLLMEACDLEKADYFQISNAMGQLADRLGSVRPARTELGLLAARTWLRLGRTANKPKHRIAKEALKRTFDSLEPFVQGDEPDVEAATLHNDVVSYLHDEGIVLKQDYVCRDCLGVGDSLRIRVPISKRWETVPLTGERVTEILEKDGNGAPRRRITFRCWSWAIKYVLRDGTDVGGDNVKRMAGAGLDEYSEWFSKITTKGKVRKGKLNRDVTAYSFEIAGMSADGKPTRVRCHYFDGERMQSYALIMRSFGDDPNLDPCMEAVLDSLSENPK